MELSEQVIGGVTVAGEAAHFNDASFTALVNATIDIIAYGAGEDRLRMCGPFPPCV